MYHPHRQSFFSTCQNGATDLGAVLVKSWSRSDTLSLLDSDPEKSSISEMSGRLPLCLLLFSFSFLPSHKIGVLQDRMPRNDC